MSESPTLPFPHHGEAERWRPVAGWEGLYEISDLGRIRSLPRETVRGVRGGRVLKPWLTMHGYETVRLCRSGYHEHRQIHRLVAAAFLGPCPEGQEVRHGPNGKLDNRASQLCYGTRKQNREDMVRDDTRPHGERQGSAKLTWVAAAEIRGRVAAGETQKSLAGEFGVGEMCVSRLVNGKTWNHQPSRSDDPGAPAGIMPPRPFGTTPESS